MKLTSFSRVSSYYPHTIFSSFDFGGAPSLCQNIFFLFRFRGSFRTTSIVISYTNRQLAVVKFLIKRITSYFLNLFLRRMEPILSLVWCQCLLLPATENATLYHARQYETVLVDTNSPRHWMYAISDWSHFATAFFSPRLLI